jgi:HTH-type transcriptional regulator / antitoxin HigA
MEKGTMKTKLIFKTMPKNYQGLLSLHMLRPIHDNVDYENSLEVLQALAGHNLTEDQEDYFEALSLFVEAYESAHLPGLPAKRGLPLLRHLMEENKMSAADLSRLFGADRSLGVRILNGERNLTIEHVKKLAIRFRVTAEVFFT